MSEKETTFETGEAVSLSDIKAAFEFIDDRLRQIAAEAIADHEKRCHGTKINSTWRYGDD